jgi:hypothetical protein
MNENICDESDDKITEWDIACKNCHISAGEYFQYIKKEKIPEGIFSCTDWYCSQSCYDEATKNEG